MPPRASSTSGVTPAPKRTRCTSDGCRKLAPPRRKRCDDHNPRLRPKAGKRYGRTEARLFTAPLRPLTRETSLGYDVIDFAAMIGEPLLPWQEWAVIHALELNPDGTFRFRTVLIKVARQNGKSNLKRIVTLWRMYKYPRCRILGIAQDVSLAREQWNLCQDTIRADPDLHAEFLKPRNVNGDEMFWLKSGSRYAIKAANRRAGRGGSNNEVNIDELREQTDWAAWGAVSKTTMARADGQLWAMTNEGDDMSVVLNHLTDLADAGTDPQLCRLEWSGPPGCEIDDWDAIAQANPGLGYVISEAAIRSAMTDPPAIFRTEVLCQRVRTIDSAIDPDGWRDCADPAGSLDGLRDRIAAFADVAEDGQHITLAVAARTPSGQVRTEIAGAWKTTDLAAAGLPLLMAQIRPGSFGWYSTGPAAGLAPVFRQLAARWNPRPVKTRQGEPARWLPDNGEVTGLKVAEACQGLAELVKGRQVLHPADPLLDAHVAGVSKLPSGDGWRFTRRNAGHADAVYAAAGAVQAALTMPEPRRARIRIIS